MLTAKIPIVLDQPYKVPSAPGPTHNYFSLQGTRDARKTSFSERGKFTRVNEALLGLMSIWDKRFRTRA